MMRRREGKRESGELRRRADEQKEQRWGGGGKTRGSLSCPPTPQVRKASLSCEHCNILSVLIPLAPPTHHWRAPRVFLRWPFGWLCASNSITNSSSFLSELMRLKQYNESKPGDHSATTRLTNSATISKRWTVPLRQQFPSDVLIFNYWRS